MMVWGVIRYVHESIKAGKAQKLVAQIYSHRLPKQWVKSAMEVENKLLAKKIKYIKTQNESILNAKEAFFNISS